MSNEADSVQPHVMTVDGKMYFAYEIKVPGGYVTGWDERTIDVIRSRWIDAWKAHASAIYELSARTTKANVKNFRAAKVEEASFGADDSDPETEAVPQWYPTTDEMLILNGIKPLDGRGSASVMANKIAGIAYKDDRKKA